MQLDPTAIRARFDLPLPDTTQPVPLVFRRAQDGEAPNCFADPGTGSVYLSIEEADRSIRSRTLEGRAAADVARTAAFRQKRDADIARALVKADAIPASEWKAEIWREATSDHVFGCLDEWQEYEFDRLWPDRPSGDEDLDKAETEARMPAWIWATAIDQWEPSIDRIIDEIAEDADEQFEEASERIDFAPLEAFLNEWAPKQGMPVFHEDRSRVIVLDQARYEAELAAARVLIAEASDAA